MSFEEFYLSQNNIKIIFNQYRDAIRIEYGEEIPASFIPKQIEIMKQKIYQFSPDKNKNMIDNIRECNNSTILELKKFYEFQKSINTFRPSKNEAQSNLPSTFPPFVSNSPQNNFPAPIKTREDSPTEIPDALKPISVKKKVKFEESESQQEEDLEVKFKKLNSIYTQSNTVQPDLVQPDLVQPDLVQPDLVQPDFVQPDLIQPDFIQLDLVQPDSNTVKIDVTEFVELFKQFLSTQKEIQESFLGNISQNLNEMKTNKELPKVSLTYNLSGNTSNNTIPLGKIINNIQSIEIIGAKIPRSQYLINYSNNTLYFSESEDISLEIKIPIGDYTITEILDNIVNSMNKVGKSKYSYLLNRNTHKITLISDLSCDDKIFTLDMIKSGISSILGFEEIIYNSNTEYTGSFRYNINPQSKIDLYFDNINPDIPFGTFYLDSDLYIYRTSHGPMKKVFGRIIKELSELNISFDYDFCGSDWEITLEITFLY
jgi:hypothetical protein